MHVSMSFSHIDNYQYLVLYAGPQYVFKNLRVKITGTTCSVRLKNGGLGKEKSKQNCTMSLGRKH